jgi:type I restriction enzyme R subunit
MKDRQECQDGSRGGQECPPSVHRSAFFDRYGEIDTTIHHLPHWQQGETWVFVTWRLGDSLPKAKLDEWKEECAIWLAHHPKPWDAKTEAEYHKRFSRQIDDWLDQGNGSSVLKDSANAKIVAGALQHFDRQRYEIASLHVLFLPLGGHALADIVKSWKGFTARRSTSGQAERGHYGRMSIGTG